MPKARDKRTVASPYYTSWLPLSSRLLEPAGPSCLFTCCLSTCRGPRWRASLPSPGWSTLVEASCFHSLSLRLEKVQQLHVTLPPFNVLSLATIRLILESFPSLQEMVVDLPVTGLWDLRSNKKDLIAIAKELDTRSVSCCISDTYKHMFVSPTVDLIKRKPVTPEVVNLYTRSLGRDLSEIIGTASSGEIMVVHLWSKLTGDAANLESCLKKIHCFYIWREPADLEVLEEEVTAANVVLNLLADEKKSGRLWFVTIPRILLLRCIDWVERFGGKEEVERSSDPVRIGYFDGNLRMY